MTCPDCRQATDGQSCPCGWRMPISADETSCAGCKREAKDARHYCVNRCARCSAHSPSVTAFLPDDEEAHPNDRGVRLCPSCWIPALKRRAGDTTGSQATCTAEACWSTVGEHIAECRRIAASTTWQARFADQRGQAPSRKPNEFTDDEMLALNSRKVVELDRYRRHVEESR